jgi:Uncharacterised nucleotidyltransferase
VELTVQDSRQRVAALIRGERLLIEGPGQADALVDCAIDDHVGPIVARTTAGRDLPEPAAARLKQHVGGRELLTAIIDQEVARVLGALAGCGVRPLVIKGAHLSHAIYRSPALRPRADTDLLIAREDRDRVADALVASGYERFPHVRGKVILGQFHFTRTDSLGVVHPLDVHWRIAAPLMFADALPFESMRSTAVPIPPLGPHAYGPSLAHALVLGCIHLTAHHRGGAILLWLHDLRLLAEALDEQQQTAFVDAAVAAGVTALCVNALEQARRYFDDPVLASLCAGLAVKGQGRSEASARLLTIARPVELLLLDLRTPAGWGTRLTLLREHLWPDPDYLRATGTHAWLPLAYADRAIRGTRKWFRASEERGLR